MIILAVCSFFVVPKILVSELSIGISVPFAHSKLTRTVDKYVTARGNTSILEMADCDVATLVDPHAYPMKLFLLIVLAITTISVLVDTVSGKPVFGCDQVVYGHQDVWSLMKLIFRRE